MLLLLLLPLMLLLGPGLVTGAALPGDATPLSVHAQGSGKLSVPRAQLAATSIGPFTLFGGAMHGWLSPQHKQKRKQRTYSNLQPLLLHSHLLVPTTTYSTIPSATFAQDR